jgi:hypothetical protein
MPATEFDTLGLKPEYVNNVRIKVTDDNVFIDFGVADPFELGANPEIVKSLLRSRIIMNRSTFQTFSQHLEDVTTAIQKAPSSDISTTILSRCPATDPQPSQDK